MENNFNLEEKYIEERVFILRKLAEIYGNQVFDIAAEEKKKLEEKRVIEKYKHLIPVNLKQYFQVAFNEFENINQLLSNEIIKIDENQLIVKVSNCNYCKMYSKFDGNIIGKKLVCNMDEVITKALNNEFTLERPKRRMDGDDFCIFEIKRELNNEKNHTD
jgi:predicted ArsR family transcriptional regulator